MRIAFYSPLPPERSGIADYSDELLQELRHHLDIVAVVRDDLVGTDRAPEGVEVVGISAAHPSDVDCDVYQMGNNPRYHRFLFQRALDQPGLLVLHDPSLADFHSELCRYVDSGVFRSEIAYDNPAFGLDATLPLLEVAPGVRDIDRLEVLLVRRMLNASIRTLVHSSAVAGVLRERYDADVETIQLFAPVLDAPLPGEGRPKGEVVFGVFGGINYYKRIDAVVEAFRELHRAFPRARLVIAGRPDDRAMTARLLALAASDELGGALEVKTKLSLVELEAEMVACDVAISLRWPTAGEMSATLMRAFGAGRPAVVTDVLQFRELDERFCWRVPAGEGEAGALLSIMTKAASAPGELAEAGRLARRFVATEATARIVAEQYVEHIEACVTTRARRLAEQAPLAPSAHLVLGVNSLDAFVAESDGAHASDVLVGGLEDAGVDVVRTIGPKRGVDDAYAGTRRPPETVVRGSGRRRRTSRRAGPPPLPSELFPRRPKAAARAFAPPGRVTTPLALVEHLHEIDLCIADARHAERLGELVRTRHRRGRRVVSYLLAESVPLSRSFTRLLRHSDELWVPSRFVADLVAGQFHAPVVVVPLPLSRTALLEPDERPSATGPLSVLALADGAHGLAYANPLAAIAAFEAAFPPAERGERAGFSLAVRNLDPSSDARRLLVERVGAIGGALVEPRSNEELGALVASSDVLVSLHRSSSFGPWCAQAMAQRVPVVATAFGGNLDYMSPSSACLVGYRSRGISEGDFYLDATGDFGFEAGQSFAEPDLAQASSWLVRLASHERLRRRIGAAAREAVLAHEHASEFASLVRARLNGLEHRSPRDEDVAFATEHPSRLGPAPAGVPSSVGARR